MAAVALRGARDTITLLGSPAPQPNALTNIPWSRWKPRLLDTLPGYTATDFVHDLIAGVTVGLVALPLAMAFAIASGVTPQAASTPRYRRLSRVALGGSRIRSAARPARSSWSWPDRRQARGLRTVHGHGDGRRDPAGAGVQGLGAAVKFIPRPIVIGFTNGIAVLIVSTQIKDFLGLTVDGCRASSFRACARTREHATIDPAALAFSRRHRWP